jgi:predicted PurR-regulated permease PerM
VPPVTSATPESPRRLILWTIAMVVLTGLLLWAAWEVREVLLLLYISALLAVGFSPIVRGIERQKVIPIGTRRLPRWLAILILYLVFIGIIVGIFLTIVPPLVRQARDLAVALPGMIDRAQDFLIYHGLIDHRITLREAVTKGPLPDASGYVDTVFSAVGSIIGGLFGFFTILILTFYLLVDADNLLGGFLQLFPRDRRPRVAAACREVTVKVSAWLMGQMILASVIGVTAAIGLWLLGIPYFYVLALIAGIGEMIPMVGPLLAALPSIAVAFSVSPAAALWVTLYYIGQQQFENHVLVPKIMERQVGVSAVTVIVALMIGGSLLGIMGAILAVPTAAILQVVVQQALQQAEPLDTMPD